MPRLTLIDPSLYRDLPAEGIMTMLLADKQRHNEADTPALRRQMQRGSDEAEIEENGRVSDENFLGPRSAHRKNNALRGKRGIKILLTTRSPGCLTWQFSSAVWPTMAVTFRGAISSKWGLSQGFVGLLPATTLARLEPPETKYIRPRLYTDPWKYLTSSAQACRIPSFSPRTRWAIIIVSSVDLMSYSKMRTERSQK